MALKQTFNTISEKCKEIFCNKQIPNGFYPSQIAAKLVRDAERSQIADADGILMPSQYTLAITREEYRMIEEIIVPLQARILVCIDEELQQLRGHTKGNLSFSFVIAGESDLQEPAAETVCEEPAADTAAETVIESEPEDEAEECDQTRVFDKVAAAEVRPAEQQAVLYVAEGIDAGKRCVFGDNRVNIGRLENNELTLTDSSVSRLHAYIVKEGGKHTIYDTRSLNGTYVNDVLVIKQMLLSGDVIKIGNTILEYEVL